MGEYQPLISVLVPSYNHERYIRNTLESIWRQPYRNIEIVVVDDCSKDNSWALLCELKEESTLRMRIALNERNLGAAATLNKALGLAQGELIVLFASDDLFTEDRFSKAVRLFETLPELKIVYANGRAFQGEKAGRRIHDERVRKLLSSGLDEIRHYLYTHVSPLFMQTALLRRELLEQVGGYDVSILADDWYMNARIFDMLHSREEFTYLNEDVVLYRVHEENVHKNFDRQSRLKLEFVEKHAPDKWKAEAYSNIHYSLAKAALARELTEKARHHLVESLRARFRIRRLAFAWKIIRAGWR